MVADIESELSDLSGLVPCDSIRTGEAGRPASVRTDRNPAGAAVAPVVAARADTPLVRLREQRPAHRRGPGVSRRLDSGAGDHRQAVSCPSGTGRGGSREAPIEPRVQRRARGGSAGYPARTVHSAGSW